MSQKELISIVSEFLNPSLSSQTDQKGPKLLNIPIETNSKEREIEKLKKLSRLLLKYYIDLKTSNGTAYSANYFITDYNTLFFGSDDMDCREGLNYLQNEAIFNYELVGGELDILINNPDDEDKKQIDVQCLIEPMPVRKDHPFLEDKND